MSYTLTVGGVSKYVQQDTLQIDKALTYQVDTCKCTILSSSRPSEGDEVIITDSTLGVIFGGIIVNVKLKDKDADLWEIDCNDYTELVDRKLVTETYENQSASAIFSDILAKYCTVDLLDGVTIGAPLVEYIQFNYVRPSECFRQLCDYVGWQWYIDETKHIKFFDAASLLTPAPINLVDATRSQWGDFKFSIDMQNLRNRVYVLGGSMYSDPATFEFIADGSQTLFNLGHKPHNLSMTVNAVAVSIGIENIDEDDGTYDYMMNYQEKYVRCGSGTSAPAVGTTIAVTYQYDIPVITFYEDKDSQDALKAVQGGDGVYEHMIKDDSIVTLEAAQALAVRDMRDNANPKVKGSFITLEPGWEPGQIDDIEYNTGAISLNGVSSCIAFEDGEIIPGPPFTIETWIRPRSPSNDYARLFVQGAGVSSINPYIYFRGDQLNVGYNSTNAVAGAPVVDGIWQHFAWTFDGATHKCYINGADVTTTAVGSGSGYTGATYIGRRQSGSYFSCDLDEFRIWGSCRTPQEIAENYNKMAPRDHPNLLAYWRFDDETGIDEKGNHNGIPVDIVKTTEGIQKLSLVIGKKTIASPWAPGQIVTINLPDRGINNSYMVQSVRIYYAADWFWQIEFGGRLMGIADFLQALVSKQQKADKNTEIITKIKSNTDTVELSDSTTTTLKSTAYLYDDAASLWDFAAFS